MENSAADILVNMSRAGDKEPNLPEESQEREFYPVLSANDYGNCMQMPFLSPFYTWDTFIPQPGMPPVYVPVPMFPPFAEVLQSFLHSFQPNGMYLVYFNSVFSVFEIDD